MNEDLGQLEIWSEAEIDARAARLAVQAAKVWIAPSLSDEELEPYRPADKKVASPYTIDDHTHLDAGTPMRELFELLRKEILALDACVTEEFLKLYIAYKAETNFVDVVAQAARLRLSLNMPFHELNDPRGIAKDVAGLGRWGNGDVEIGLTVEGDLPYVLGLIRQSLERQMGSGQVES